jgi:DNA-binding transcriptional ArsR family regulator/YHS domain-containing protein
MMKTVFELESDIYATLAHPKRLEILHLLAHKKLTVGEIVVMTGLTQATVSQHLMLLKKLLLVQSQKHAQQRVYSLSSIKLSKLLATSRSLLVGSHVLPEIHTDPICGMEITVHNAATSLVHGHTQYYFCGFGCEKQFIKQKRITKEAHV